jgi:hypothetical protein
MINKELTEIAEADLEALITSDVSEGKSIEYKSTLPGNGDAERKELLADVSSFANTIGGDVLYGMEEQNGVPVKAIGLVVADLDLQLRQLDSIISNGLEPRIRYAVHIVRLQNERPVIILRIERSWIGPHRVVFKSHDKFYARNSAGKYPLDVAELRTAFTASETVNERIRGFRTDRIIALSNNETPVPLPPDPKIVMHFVPIESFGGAVQRDCIQFYKNPVLLAPMVQTAGWERRINLDGVVIFSGGTASHSYTQLYRSGIVEAVNGTTLNPSGKNVIPSRSYEERILGYLPLCFGALQRMGVQAPIVFALTLTNVKGLRMGIGDRFVINPGYPIDSDTLLLPEIVIDDFTTSPTDILLPLFNLVWNACGYERSQNFDESGKWIERLGYS